MPHFDTNLPSDYGWGPASKNGENIVPFSYHGHKFYNGVRKEMVNWFNHLCDLVVPMIPGGLYTAHATPSVDDGDWGYEYRVSRNSNQPSVHSWGACLDFNAVQNPNGAHPADGNRFVLGSNIQAAVRTIGGLHGRGWGDNMHIECKLDPQEIIAFNKSHPASGTPAPAPKPTPVPTKGDWPLTGNQYFGPLNGPADSISGMYKNDTAAQKTAIKRIQVKVGVAADGAYGPGTMAAVKRWQQAHHLSADGLCGRKTWAAMGL